MAHSERLADAEVDAEVPPAVWWNIDQVADWVTRLGFPQYVECFTNNYIDGKKLILIDISTLPKIGITDFHHIKVMMAALRELLRRPDPDHSRCLSLPETDPLGLYLWQRAQTGPRSQGLSYSTFLRRNKLMFTRLYWK